MLLDDCFSLVLFFGVVHFIENNACIVHEFILEPMPMIEFILRFCSRVSGRLSVVIGYSCFHIESLFFLDVSSLFNEPVFIELLVT